MPQSVLFVDDDPDSRLAVELLLRRAGFEVQTLSTGREALQLLQTEQFDVVMSDMRMPKMDGISLLKRIKLEHSDLPVVMYTGHATIQTAVQATREGAEDYVTKPCTESELLHVLGRVLDRRRLLEENRRLQAKLVEKFQLGNIIGISSSMQEVYSLIEKAARTTANVVIYGETGTGKELIAKAIHYSGPQAGQPMISLNCGAIPENLLESELFGYSKGAFTGAARDKPGLLESARGGTIFLDEIAELHLSMQVKLLRVLEEREFRRLGDTRLRRMAARIVAATNRDLSALV
ncbi:MAG: sigma-54 dependent transcriptional regulator, partial [Candidatus Neomarinimicrobiota bacterium]